MPKHTPRERAKRSVRRQKKTTKKAKLGTGKRFAALKSSIEASSKVPGRKNVRNPGALAASIGRKKFGKKKFSKLSATGRRRRR